MEPSRSGSLSISLRFFVVIGALTPLWLMVAGFVGPWTIRQLYEGRGPAFMVAALGGRGGTPLDSYLQVWANAARSISVLLVLGTLLTYVAIRLIVAVRTPYPALAGSDVDAADVTGGASMGGSAAVAEEHVVAA